MCYISYIFKKCPGHSDEMGLASRSLLSFLSSFFNARLLTLYACVDKNGILVIPNEIKVYI